MALCVCNHAHAHSPRSGQRLRSSWCGSIGFRNAGSVLRLSCSATHRSCAQPRRRDFACLATCASTPRCKRRVALDRNAWHRSRDLPSRPVAVLPVPRGRRGDSPFCRGTHSRRLGQCRWHDRAFRRGACDASRVEFDRRVRRVGHGAQAPSAVYGSFRNRSYDARPAFHALRDAAPVMGNCDDGVVCRRPLRCNRAGPRTRIQLDGRAAPKCHLCRGSPSRIVGC